MVLALILIRFCCCRASSSKSIRKVAAPYNSPVAVFRSRSNNNNEEEVVEETRNAKVARGSPRRHRGVAGRPTGSSPKSRQTKFNGDTKLQIDAIL